MLSTNIHMHVSQNYLTTTHYVDKSQYLARQRLTFITFAVKYLVISIYIFKLVLIKFLNVFTHATYTSIFSTTNVEILL